MLIININNKKIECKQGENLYKALLEGGISLNAPCGGFGTCGKCFVWVEGIGKVKACRFSVNDNISVSLIMPKSAIATKGLLRKVNCDNKSPCIAVDIGTTTVAAYLINNGEIVDVESSLNLQKSYGDDVISRIKFASENEKGTRILSGLINKQVDEMAQILQKRNNIKTKTIAVAGNTTMLHLFANVSPAPIGVAPFTPVFTDIKKIGNATLLPSVSGYVGADTVAAVLASGMHLSSGKSLLIDIGTNSEIALGNNESIITCAAAAGPAFEGAQISCGIGGVAGAIDSISLEQGIKFSTIDNAKPIGICGSAIIDVTAQMLKNGLIDETGYFEQECLEITDGITITAQDIRQVQLAKSAIAAGINTLLEESDTSLDEIENCFLAGGFGSYLNKKSACDIGLIPRGLLDKIKPIGNAAGMGAVLWLTSEECKKQTMHIIEIAKYFELSDSSLFSEQFIRCMYF